MGLKIFFVHSGNETFTQIDKEILGKFSFVNDFFADKKFPFYLTNYLKGVRSSNILFCWFASWNSLWAIFFAKLFKKPSILVIGGYDLAHLPEASYGQQRKGFGRVISRFAIKNATKLFTNSYFSQKEADQNAGFSPNLINVIYHGVPDKFGDLNIVPRQKIALTVGKIDWPNLKRKGLEFFVKTAHLLPDVEFILVGKWADNSIDFLRSISSDNITFTGSVNEDELLSFYKKASIYVQPSLHEGFGMSVAEAMLAGCIPVVSKNGALPEVVGNCGYYCQSVNPKDIAVAIVEALNSPLSLREKARNRILTEFPLEKRSKQIEQLIYSINLPKK